MEARKWVSNPSEVTHFEIECEEKAEKATNEITNNEYSNHSNFQITQTKIPRLLMVSGMYIGDKEESTEIAKFTKAFDYMLQEWPKLPAKYAKIYMQNADLSENEDDWIWNSRKTQFEPFQGTVFDYDKIEDQFHNVTIESFKMKWGGTT